MAEIKVTPSFLRDNSAKFKNYGNNCTNVLEQIRRELNSMRGCWEGQASSAFFAKFDKLCSNFPTYTQKMQQYSDYLGTAATEYAQTENAVKSKAQSASELNVRR